jgi:hypothetical protein
LTTKGIADKILARTKRHEAGCVFSAKHLADLGTPAAVDQALSRLVKDDKVRRLSGRLYGLPQVHPFWDRFGRARTR